MHNSPIARSRTTEPPVNASDPLEAAVVAPTPAVLVPSPVDEPDEPVDEPDEPDEPDDAVAPATVVVVAPPDVVVDVVLDGPVVDVVDVGEVVEPGGPGTADHWKPLVSEALAVKVTSVFQKSDRTPLLLAQAMPASHTPLAVLPLPLNSNVVSDIPSLLTSGPHSKLLGMLMTSPVVTAVDWFSQNAPVVLGMP